jgi:sec-independent protein translocase protein TatA
MNFGTTEIILIVAVLFLLFGATRLPQLAKSLGQSRKAFKDGMREAEEEERMEQEQKRLHESRNVTAGATLNSASASDVDDETLFEEEARRRSAQMKQQ